MRTVQMTLDEKLVEEVDKLVGELKTTRSAFTRDALRQALLTARTVAKEAEWIAAYERIPVRNGEFLPLIDLPPISDEEQKIWTEAMYAGMRSKLPTKRDRSSSSRATSRSVGSRK